MSRHAVVTCSVAVFVFVFATATGALADTRALWHMDDTDGTMSDASPYSNTGQLNNVAVGQPPLVSGTSFGFDAADGPDSYITVPDNDSLDPGAADITITAWVSLTGPILDDSYDIVRKGLGKTPGGDWKMEIKNLRNQGAVGKLKCTFRGDVSTVIKTARPDIIDGQPHELKCIKTPDSVIAVVDGRSFRKSGTVGSIANEAQTMLGSKVPGDDEYNGRLDEISVAFTETDPAPTVTGFDPISGAIGAPVTVTGTAFTGATTVTFNGTPATFTVTNGTTINTSVPAGATSGPIAVTTPSGTGTSASNFTVTQPPAGPAMVQHMLNTGT